MQDMRPGLVTDGVVESIGARGLTEETCRKFDYRVSTFKGSRCHVAPYYDATGQLVAQKIRYKEDGKKAFSFLGEPRRATLFGQRHAQEGGKMLVITEGEIDAMSVSQALGNKWPAVSVPNGAQGAAKAIKANIEFVESFEKVVLCFDADEPGQLALEECVLLLTPGKAHIAQLPAGLKDANDCVKANRSADLTRAIWDAKAYRPDGIRTVEDVWEQASQPVQMGLSWPFKTLTDATYGIRRKEMYGLGAGVGCGKTETFKEFVAHTIAPDGDLSRGRPAGLLFLEEPVAHTVKVIAGKLVNKQFHIPGIEFSTEEIHAALELLKGRLYVFDHFGAKDYEDVKAKIVFMVVSLGIKDIYLDHLTALVAGVDDERRALDHIMADLAGLCDRYDFTLYYISHLTTPDGKPHEEGGRVYERHFAGSRAIARWSHFMFALERDKQDPNGVTTFRILKDRYTGRATGVTFGLGYERATGRMVECGLDAEGPFSDETHGDL